MQKMKSSNNKFRFFAPVDLLEKGKDKKGNDVYKVGGVISDPSTDSDGENLDPSGFDFSEFNYINWNHGKSPSDIIGEPESWKVLPNKSVYMEGYIYPESDKGQEAIELMKVLQNSKKGNHLGWSVEGQVLERDVMNENRVTKARITAVALCPFPKNGNTFAQLLKKGFTDDCFQSDEDLVYENQDSEGNLIKEALEDGQEVIVDKEGNIIVNKAQTTENSAAVIKEDVEGNEKELLKSAIVTIVEAHKQGLATDEQLLKCKNFIKFLDVRE